MSVEAMSQSSTSVRDRIVLWIATGFGIGRIPGSPGTFGTLWGLPLAWGLFGTGWPYPWALGVLALLCLAGVPICTRGAALLGLKDPGPVVYDELASLPLAFLWADFNWPWAAAAFLVFRLLDITKPWPIRWFERLPGGWGIMADDIAAGLLTGAILYAGQTWVTPG